MFTSIPAGGDKRHIGIVLVLQGCRGGSRTAIVVRFLLCAQCGSIRRERTVEGDSPYGGSVH